MIERTYLVIDINKKHGPYMTLEIQKKITKDYFLRYEIKKDHEIEFQVTEKQSFTRN